MDHAVVTRTYGGHACLLQTLGVAFTLVAQRIIFRGDYQRGRQAAQVRRAQRRCVRVVSLAGIVQVVSPEPDDHVARDEIIACIGNQGGGRRGVIIGHGVNEQLAAQARSALVTNTHCGHRCQIATGAVACQRDPGRVSVELDGMLRGPTGGGQTVVRRGGKLVLRR